MSDFQPPPRFVAMPKLNNFNDTIAPVYLRLDKGGITAGLRVEEQHMNSMGMCHGAVYMALMDVALALNICHAVGKFFGTPTINITLDYLTAAKLGTWMEVETQVLKTTRNFGFAQALVRSEHGIHLRASGTFKLPKDIENTPGATIEQFAQGLGLPLP